MQLPSEGRPHTRTLSSMEDRNDWEDARCAFVRDTRVRKAGNTTYVELEVRDFLACGSVRIGGMHLVEVDGVPDQIRIDEEEGILW
jgi:hypothetical protein